jgi:hypothetical protein
VPPGTSKKGEGLVWCGDEGLVWVKFNGAGQINLAAFFETGAEAGPLETLRWRLNRRWGRLWGK